MSQYWSHLIHGLTPYVPGEQPKINNLIKLNTNENPYGPSPKVLLALQKEASESLRLYPDPNSDVLRKAIASFHGLETSNVFVGNGSDEVLAHTFNALLKHDQPILFPDITYSFYPVYCGLYEIAFETIPLSDNFEIQVRPRSGLAAKNGVTVLNTPGTIDADYRGELKVILINHGDEDFTIKNGDRIAQAVIASVISKNFVKFIKLEEVNPNTERGTGGFGSTGQ